MSDRTQDLTNHRKVATACKNYTDTQIAQAKEEIYWHIGEYSVTTSDDNTSASVKTVPSNATRCKIKRVYGNTQKLNPTTASDSTKAMIKTMPSTVYTFDGSKFYGASEVCINLFNKNTVTLDVVLNPGDGSTQTDTNYFTSDFIEVDSNTLYSYSVPNINFYTCYYNSSKQYISGTTYQTNFTTSSTTKYIKFSAYKIRLDTFVICKGEYYTGIHNFAWNGIVIKDSNDDTQQTIPIDLSTILYNGNPLFEENALKGVGTAKDYITPYKAYKVMGSYTFTGNENVVVRNTTTNWTRIEIDVALPNSSVAELKTNILCSNGCPAGNGYSGTSYCIETSGRNIYAVVPYVDGTANDFKSLFPSGTVMLYELATPIEVSINWASTLRGITGYSNGTITLLNTYNMDSANLITYNSIIKENCCAKMVQSRNGSVIKTINFPTQASDGYSAGSVANVRDFTTNTRTPYVAKVDLGTLDYYYVSDSAYPYFICYDISSVINKPADNYTKANILSVLENQRAVDIRNNGYLGVAIDNNGYIRIATSTMGTDATVFKNAMSGTYLYYEKATSTSTAITPIENVIEVEAGDTLTFVNENNQAVPSDLTYRIEVER